MIVDICKWLVLYILVLFSFGCGLNQLLWYFLSRKWYHIFRKLNLLLVGIMQLWRRQSVTAFQEEKLIGR